MCKNILNYSSMFYNCLIKRMSKNRNKVEKFEMFKIPELTDKSLSFPGCVIRSSM